MRAHVAATMTQLPDTPAAPLHLSRVAFGCNGIPMLEARLAANRRSDRVALSTRYAPKRSAELAGGSLYWIIAHRIVARSPLLAIEPGDDGRTALVIEPRIVLVRPVARRSHQGWRYLAGTDAPPDLDHGAMQAGSDPLPDALARDLADIALI